MSLSVGIVGLPNVGKSTLFNALTSNTALAANYPFATIDPNVGIVSVPDARLEQVARLYPGAPLVRADLRFTDIAGLVAGASKGEGLGNQFLANIRETAAIAHVVRAFTDPNVTHVSDSIDPKADIETIHTELILSDLQSIDKKLPSLEKLARSDPSSRNDQRVLSDLKSALDEGILITNFVHPKTLSEYLSEAEISDELTNFIRQLITTKPIIFVFNVDEATLGDSEKLAELEAIAAPHASVYICAQLEAELDGLEPDERVEMLAEYGLSASGLERFIQQSFATLGLHSFFTAGEKEVRSWTTRIGSTAPEAAGVIHSDFQRGFIAAEIIPWDELIAAGSRSEARKIGKIRTEGKDYIIQDGDVAEFRFNV